MTVSLIERPSPNRDARPAGQPVDILLLHYTGMADAESALARLTDAASNVSAHYTVDEDGTVYRHVPESERAWHAGVSFWAGATDINGRSIGVELVNPGHEFGYRPFPDAQIDALIRLCTDILARHPIPPARVLAHADVAPARKSDPGELFPWRRLAEHGIGLWPGTVRRYRRATMRRGDNGPRVATFQRKLAAYGYGLSVSGTYDAQTVAAVTAFQRHFRPAAVTGEADGGTHGTLAALLALSRPRS